MGGLSIKSQFISKWPHTPWMKQNHKNQSAMKKYSKRSSAKSHVFTRLTLFSTKCKREVATDSSKPQISKTIKSSSKTTLSKAWKTKPTYGK
jgi:hypothetical protein